MFDSPVSSLLDTCGAGVFGVMELVTLPTFEFWASDYLFLSSPNLLPIPPNPVPDPLAV